ncbi:MAG TPA: UpxY family transcription antiterminator [Bacteroidales bacterium]|nr:UpxY family transcription antiterminator [Bacteroidales bacterium]
MGNTNNNWYVFYTRPNAEKVVCNELLKRQYDAFLPMVKTLHRWKNRQNKIVSKVLFPGYIFVRTVESEIFNIVQTPKIVFCVKSGDRPGVVPDRDIKCIEQMLGLGLEVFTEYDFTEGEHVRVVRGPLVGYEGVLIKRNGKYRFGVQLNDIKQCAFIDISASMLEKA